MAACQGIAVVTHVTDKKPGNCTQKEGTTYFENPRPSILTTIHVFDSRTSGCSKARTYSYLIYVSSGSLLNSCKLISGHPTHQRWESWTSWTTGTYLELISGHSTHQRWTTDTYFELAISQRRVKLAHSTHPLAQRTFSYKKESGVITVSPIGQCVQARF